MKNVGFSRKGVTVIAAFPGCGKTHVANRYNGLHISDSDSSQFPKNGFPRNYINHIMSKFESSDVILVSTHKVVIDALIDEGVKFYLVYPAIECKDEYIQRYQERGSSESFIATLEHSWDTFLASLHAVNHENVTHHILYSNVHLSDVFEDILCHSNH